MGPSTRKPNFKFQSRRLLGPVQLEGNHGPGSPPSRAPGGASVGFRLAASSDLVGQAVFYRWPVDQPGWVRGWSQPDRRVLAPHALHTAVARVTVPSLLDVASHGPAGRWVFLRRVTHNPGFPLAGQPLWASAFRLTGRMPIASCKRAMTTADLAPLAIESIERIELRFGEREKTFSLRCHSPGRTSSLSCASESA